MLDLRSSMFWCVLLIVLNQSNPHIVEILSEIFAAAASPVNSLSRSGLQSLSIETDFESFVSPSILIW